MPITKRVVSLFRQSDGRQRLAERAQRRINDVDTLCKNVLYPALLVLRGGGDGLSEYIEPLREHVDREFFVRLWADLDLDETETRIRWLKAIEPVAKRLLDRAPRALPLPVSRRLELTVRAYSLYLGALNKNFPDYFESKYGRERKDEAQLFVSEEVAQ